MESDLAISRNINLNLIEHSLISEQKRLANELYLRNESDHAAQNHSQINKVNTRLNKRNTRLNPKLIHCLLCLGADIEMYGRM